MVCSLRVTGAIPRTPVATVAIPLQRISDKAITGIAPFYISVASGLNAPAVTPRHHGIPRRGWVAPGHRLLEEAIATYKEKPQVLRCLRRFTATTYNGALLARVLGEEYKLPASDAAVNITLRNMERHLQHFRGGPQTAAYNTRSNQLLQFIAGARVFIRASTSGEWFPGQVSRTHRDGTMAVRYDDETLQQADPHVAHKELSNVRADVACSSSHNPKQTRATTDPEEDTDTSTAEVAEFMANAGERHLGASSPDESPTFLDALLAVGEYTALVDVVYGSKPPRLILLGNEWPWIMLCQMKY
ncbi:hypothetical protein AB1Y20_000405 [Prymnesium parvum]|uniref:Uncharacterized protein n=1 Tax=Prymnesium parvum TaxID=97485 RepID=A0AB34K4L8_PRYPA